MATEEAPQTASVGQNGSSVNINLGHGFRQFQIIIIALVVALVFSCTLAIVAYLQASEAKYQAAMWAYWGSRVEATLQARGIDIPASPAKEGN